MFHFPVRSTAPEILDDFELKGNDLSENLRELEKVNRFLGGYRIVLEGVEKLIESKHLKGAVKIVDVGSGGGDTLKAVASWGSAKNLNLELTGIDANAAAVAHAIEETRGFPQVSIRHCDIFSEEFKSLPADIVMFNLVLHHFTDEQIVEILKTCREKGSCILINDLQRSRIAHLLFRAASRAMGFSYIGRHDGKLSIRKSFRENDWLQLLAKSGIKEFGIHWRWAFRYLVLVY